MITQLTRPVDAPDDEPLTEFVDGKEVELPPTSNLAQFVRADLSTKLTVFVAERALGRVFPDTLFGVPQAGDPERGRRPDVAFVANETWPRDRPIRRHRAVQFVPDLVAEIVSPTDRGTDLFSKVHDYLAAGVRLVWLIDPEARYALAFTSLREVRGLTADDELDGAPVLPGFRVRLADLIPPVLPDEG